MLECGMRPKTEPRIKRRIKFAALAFLVIALVAWFFPPGPYRMYWKLDIQEVAARHLVDGSALSKVDINVEGRRPSAALLSRLADLTGQPADRTTLSESQPLQCRVSSPRWINLATVEVPVSSWESPEAGYHCVLILRLTPSGWQIVGEKDTVVA